MRTVRQYALAAFIGSGLLAQGIAWEATIKPARPTENEALVISSGGHRLQSIYSPVADVITFCYGVHRNQIMDGSFPV